ncbi:MAG: radical SAM/SPASM domain-containing protein [archaeon]
MEDVDHHKLMYHPRRVGEWYEKGDCYPIYVEIAPTNLCNHKCVFCALDFLEKSSDFFDRDVMLSLLKEMGEKGVKSIMFAGEGEPALHKDIGLFVQKAKQFGLDISMTTNGVLLTKSKIEDCLPHLSWIRFSIDSGSPENYALVHGTSSDDFNRLVENLRECVRVKRELGLNVVIGTQFLVIPQNMGEAVKLAGMLKEIGVDNLQIKPYSQHPDSVNRLVVDLDEYNSLEAPLKELETDEFKIFFRKATAQRIHEGATYKKCHGLPFFALIDANGNIIPCNLFYGKKEFSYGNLYEKSFSEIWESERRRKVVRKLNEIGVESCRHGCRLDSINRYLHRLTNPLGHDNFV